MTSRLREVILPLCSALIRPHLVFCIQFWSHQHKTDIKLLKQVQRRVMQVIRAGTPCLWEQAETAGALQPGEEKPPERLCGGLPVPEGDLKESWGGTFLRAGSNRMRENGFKLEEGRFRLDIRKKFCKG